MDQRLDRRFPVEEAAVMRVEGQAGGVYVVTVLDVSKSGMRVSCPISLPLETPVTVRCHGAEISGNVRYARNIGFYGFHLGIKANVVSRGGQIENADFDLTELFRVG
jgi:hypothetical protein